MDTPERSKVGTPTSKVEDSPVFSFINSLSPIQPVKSTHSAQAFHSLNLASISSVFTSPRVNLQREATFLVRHSVSELPKHEISCNNGDGHNSCVGTSQAVKPSVSTVTCSLNEAAVDNPDECSSSPCDLPQSVPYDCGSPNHNTTPCYIIKSELKLGLGHTPEELVEYDQDGLDKRKILFGTETEHQNEQSEAEVAEYDWESMIPNDVLIFESSAELETCEVPGERFHHDDEDAKPFTSFPSHIQKNAVDDLKKTEPDSLFVPYLHEDKNIPLIEQYEGDRELDETDHRPQVFSENCENQAVANNRNHEMGHGSTSGISTACKVESQQQRGVRRRCLNFEVPGVPKMSLQNVSTACNSNGPYPSSDSDRQPVPFKVGNPLSCMLPGIGLHLNSLATSSKDRFISQETLVSGQRLLSLPSSSPFPPTGQEPQNKPLSFEKDLVNGSGIHNLKIMPNDVSKESALISGKDLHQSSSPKKKRRKVEVDAESEGCKRCNCKKSKCLKLYCECFAAGVFCAEPCSCQGCFNKPIHQETVLNTRKQIESRNPLAFAPKVIRPCELVQEIGDEANKTPASARHKRGCNCKKSSCLKKYCECYQGGVGCSVSCRCEGCKNAFGRKDGILLIEDEEFEQEEEQKDASQNVNDGLDEGEQIADPKQDEHQYAESVLHSRPFQVIRPSIDVSILSTSKTPRSSTFTSGNSACFNSSTTLRKFEIPLSHCKLGKHVSVDSEEETPAILRGSVSPSNSVKTTSPNQKRVSPPQFVEIVIKWSIFIEINTILHLFHAVVLTPRTNCQMAWYLKVLYFSVNFVRISVHGDGNHVDGSSYFGLQQLEVLFGCVMVSDYCDHCTMLGQCGILGHPNVSMPYLNVMWNIWLSALPSNCPKTTTLGSMSLCNALP
ncbi:hypothetical protein J5N97_027541 [Dioscorea zingiberensis]|uniref:CRC domain-containing protein n=1 Tax=Dioscorea zingiberensis TaxID=325984 RepID=A0A9D5C508_9LILI|nr:hypothetical protein J5N97_027541 [Dioscorea zingiberensis]